MQGLKQVFVSAVTDIHTADKEGVGTHRWLRDANGWKCYKYVRNTSAATLVVGNVLFHGTTGFGITTGSNPSTYLEEVFSAGQAAKNALITQMAGVAVSAIPTGSYGWVQCYGYSAAVLIEGTVAIVIGDSLKGVSGQLYVVKDAAAGAISISPQYIRALVAEAGGAGQRTLVGAFLFCN